MHMFNLPEVKRVLQMHDIEPIGPEMLDKSWPWKLRQWLMQTKFYMYKDEKRSCTSHSKLGMVIVSCSVLVWTGDNNHAHCSKPNSENLDQTQTWSQIKMLKKK